MLFAPSTIAIAALILSFSILRTDCTSWLSSIPNFCLPLSDNPLSQSNSNSPCMGVGVGVTHHSYYCDRNGFATNSSPTSSPFTSRQNRNFRLFDIDKCLMSFKPVEAKYSRRNSSGKNIHNVSPTSVIDLSPSELMTPTKENVQIVHDLNGRNELNDRIYETHGLENATNGNSMITVNLDKVDKNSNTNNSKYDIQDTIEKIKLKNKRSFSLNNLVPDHEKSCRVSVCLAGDLDFFVNTENKETNNDINRDDIDFQLNKRVRCENLNKIKEKDLRNRKIKINILDISVNNKIKENCGKKHRAAFSPISFSTSKTISM